MAEMARERFDENWRFRSFLKGYDADVEEIDATVHEIYREVSAQIDCTACANCCKIVSPVLNMADIQKFSEGLGISVSKMMDEHIARHKKSDRFRFNKKPCPFLEGNLCSNYDHRPGDCRSFPHLHRPDFIFRLWNVANNCTVCPIVFNVYERLKIVFAFRC